MHNKYDSLIMISMECNEHEHETENRARVRPLGIKSQGIRASVRPLV